MKKIILSVLLLSVTAIAGAQEPVAIVKQGHFSVGGTTTQRPGAYDNRKFVGWVEQEETGQSYRADHAFVDFQIPVNAKKLPLVYVARLRRLRRLLADDPRRTGRLCYVDATPWLEQLVADLPGRGRAGRTSATTTVKPVTDEMFWFDIWRIGIWPNYNEGVQFPKDSVSLSQFFREMTPDLSDHKEDVPALGALADRIGDHILVTHSAGGFPGWMSAMQNPQVKAVVSYEPGGFVFPEREVPERIDGLTEA